MIYVMSLTDLFSSFAFHFFMSACVPHPRYLALGVMPRNRVYITTAYGLLLDLNLLFDFVRFSHRKSSMDVAGPV